MLDKPKNANYCATVTILQEFVNLDNCDNLKAALIFGNSVIVGKDAKVGDIGLFFPVECKLSEEFLKENNLYRKPELNNEATQKGYFEAHGRIKAMKFRGHKSEGFFIPLSSLNYLTDFKGTLEVGDVFDKIEGHLICEKYIPAHNPASQQTKGKKASLKDSVVDGQFRFHFDTENLRKNIHKIQPTDIISISDKWHGTSAIISKPLIICHLSWYEKLLKKLGVKIQETQYGLVYSSRKMIKAVDGIDKSNGIHFYGEDIWGIIEKEVADKIPVSYTVYGEIVGYTPTGSPIQSASKGRPYHYGCSKGSHKFVVYRVTTTNADGKTLELSWPQMREFCNKYGFEMVHEWFYGRADDLLSYLTVKYAGNDSNEDGIRVWQKELLKVIEENYVNNKPCPFNNNEVPAEGIVVRRDRLTECESWKLKNFAFLEDETKMLDIGTVDIETAESEEN